MGSLIEVLPKGLPSELHAQNVAAANGTAKQETPPPPASAEARPLQIGGQLEELAAKSSKIMIVDDEQTNVLVVERFLYLAGYRRFVTTTDSTQAMNLMKREKPDTLLLDIMMPFVSGLDILNDMRADEQLKNLPVIILTASNDADTKTQCLELRVTDFLNKPVDQHDLVPRVRNALIVKAHMDNLSDTARRLEVQVRHRTAELIASRQEVILCLARAAEFRDNETGMHVVRVGRYVRLIADAMGFTPEDAELMEMAAQLHDVGKIGIPDAILQKPRKLDPEEYEMMQRHCGLGRRIIERFPEHEVDAVRRHTEIGGSMLQSVGSPILRVAARIALTHHERYDGTGYPLGLAGDDIPLEGRMTAVADVFDALSSKRPYKDPMPRERCFEILEEARGTHFDPRVLDAFFSRKESIVETQIQCADPD